MTVRIIKDKKFIDRNLEKIRVNLAYRIEVEVEIDTIKKCINIIHIIMIRMKEDKEINKKHKKSFQTKRKLIPIRRSSNIIAVTYNSLVFY